MIDTTEFHSIELPKWAQMIVSGKPVSIEQAKEIIFRTDEFLTSSYQYSGGNSRKFNENYRKQSGLEQLVNYEQGLLLHECLGIIYTDWCYNCHSSSCLVDCHGWCLPSGKIEFYGNVGALATISEVLNDWQKLATAFPYLDLTATLMNGESMDDDVKPLVNIRVINGNATLCEPDTTVHPVIDICKDPELFNDGEHSGVLLPYSWYDDYSTIVRNAIERYKI